jgi:hypothetical protein
MHLVLSYTQAPLKNVGWESTIYKATADAFRSGDQPTGTMPAVARIGVPFVVSLMPFETADGFSFLNLCANFLSTILLFVWLKRRLSEGLSIGLTLAFCVHWLGPTRFAYWAPISTDPWAFVALIAGLLIIDAKLSSRQVLIISLVALSGVLIRESVIVVPIVFAVKLITQRGPRWLLYSVLPLIASAIGLFIVRSQVHMTADIGLLQTMYHWAFEKTFPEVVLGFFMSFGIGGVLAFSRKTRTHITAHPEHLAFVIVLGMAAWFGGTDTERIFLWSAPIMLLWIGYGLERSRFLIIASASFSALTCRLFWETPQYPGGPTDVMRFLTPLTSDVLYTELLSFHMLRGSSALIVIQYMTLTALLLMLRHFVTKRDDLRVHL